MEVESMPDLPDFPTKDDDQDVEEDKQDAPDRQSIIDRIIGGGPTTG
jgi:hypothetical protein